MKKYGQQFIAIAIRPGDYAVNFHM